MTTRHCYLCGTFGAFLSDDVAEIRAGGRLDGLLPADGEISHEEVVARFVPGDDPEHVRQVFDAVHGGGGEFGRLQGGLFREDAPVEALPGRKFHDREGARDIADVPVKA